VEKPFSANQIRTTVCDLLSEGRARVQA